MNNYLIVYAERETNTQFLCRVIIAESFSQAELTFFRVVENQNARIVQMTIVS